MLLEPSKGLIKTMYLFWFFLSAWVMAMKLSSSSEAMPQMISRFVKALIKVSFAKTSNFYCDSPEEFCAPSPPIKSIKPA